MKRIRAGGVLVWACALLLAGCGSGGTKTVVKTVTTTTTAPASTTTTTSAGGATQTTTTPRKTPSPASAAPKLRAVMRQAHAICKRYPALLPPLPPQNKRAVLAPPAQDAVSRLVPLVVQLQQVGRKAASGPILLPFTTTIQQLSALYSQLSGAPLKAKQIAAMRKQIRSLLSLAHRQATALGLPGCAPRTV